MQSIESVTQHMDVSNNGLLFTLHFAPFLKWGGKGVICSLTAQLTLVKHLLPLPYRCLHIELALISSQTLQLDLHTGSFYLLLSLRSG